MNLYPAKQSSSEVMMRRLRLWRRQYLHVVIYTSLFWIVVDVFFIMLFSDCTKEIIVPCSSPQQSIIYQKEPIDVHQRPKSKPKKSPGLIAQIFGGNPGEISRRDDLHSSELDAADANPSHWPGESGRAVAIPSQLKEDAKTRFKENQFNIVASDLMALNRSINDQRSSKFVRHFVHRVRSAIDSFRCRSHEFPADLPSTSIVIVFHNEGNSTLLRTLTSIVNRSPVEFIQEIIMVDDASVERGGRDQLSDEFPFVCIDFRF